MSSEPVAKKQRMSTKKPYATYKSNRKQFLEVGLRGFLATCNFREKDCVRECYNILNQYADELYGPSEKVADNATAAENKEDTVDTGDISEELQREIAATKQKGKDVPKQRFQVVDTGTTNCLFIRTTLPDPVELGATIVKDIASSHEQKSRYLLRLVPIEAVCRANLTDILKTGGELFDKHFLKQGSTFAIVFNKRYNNDIKRDAIIQELAALVQAKHVDNRVDLKQAEKTIVVEVIKGLCCLSVVEGYLQYKKYNLVELANVKTELQMKDATIEIKQGATTADEEPTTKEEMEVTSTEEHTNNAVVNEDKIEAAIVVDKCENKSETIL